MRKSFYLLLFLYLGLVTGCRSVRLEPKWLPLTHVLERYYTTDSIWAFSPYMLVDDLDEWKKKDEVDKAIDIIHERVHAIREEEEGLIIYLYKYYFVPGFKKREEKLAYYIHIRYMLDKKQRVNPDFYAEVLSGKLYNYMMSYVEARQWVKNIISGAYAPPIDPKYLIPD